MTPIRVPVYGYHATTTRDNEPQMRTHQTERHMANWLPLQDLGAQIRDKSTKFGPITELLLLLKGQIREASRACSPSIMAVIRGRISASLSGSNKAARLPAYPDLFCWIWFKMMVDDLVVGNYYCVGCGISGSCLEAGKTSFFNFTFEPHSVLW